MSSPSSLFRTALSRISSLLTPRSTLSGRELQLRLDTAQLFLSLPAHLRHPPYSPSPLTPEQSHIATLLNAPTLPPFEDQAALVSAYLTASARSQLLALSATLRSAANVESTLREKLGFVPVVQESRIPNAGRGVHVLGTAPRGSLLSLYPGVSYLPSQVRRLAGGGNDYWISRFDGVVIDGAADVQLDISVPAAAEEAELVHPFALGHLVNHPPTGVKANCLQFMLDVDIAKLPDGAGELIPNENFADVAGVLERVENEAYRQRVPGSTRFFKKGGGAGGVRRTVALVAMRDIRDEEVFMNYRFNPQAPGLPEWYHDCDPEGSKRRWNRKGVFF